MGATSASFRNANRFFAAFVLFAALFPLHSVPCPAGDKFPLLEGWEFRKIESGQPWRKAVVPGSVYTDLASSKLIPDPLTGCNHQDLQWVSDSAWEYRLEFKPDPMMYTGTRLFLTFEGLDTLAEVSLNGSHLFRADNMFRRWSCEIGSKIQPGANTLHILFHPAPAYCRDQAKKMDHPLPGGEWAFIRKAPFQFGWDFAPRLPGVGIWQPVYLETRPELVLEDAAVTTCRADEREAELRAIFLISSSEKNRAVLKVLDDSGRLLFHRSSDIDVGEQTVSGTFRIRNPGLWWPSGMGLQTLTPLRMVIEPERSPTQSVDLQVGIRQLERVEEPDDTGRSFFFRVNGQPFFARGANIVPPHSLLPWSPELWTQRVRDAVESRFNMLRVWGGGIYPPDEFFSACDHLGILVWQDFAFACSMVPWDDEFVENVRIEAIQQVVRLRKHASLALWCGNNEIDEGWHNWGWQNQLNDPEQVRRVWEGYRRLFHHVLAEVVREGDPDRSYKPSSPLYGWGRSESLKQGDAHYWGVWWGREPFEVYRRKVPRFMSEFGFQSYPVMATVLDFGDRHTMPEESLLACHQKHATGFEIIHEAMAREHFSPRSLREEIYFSQVVQAIAYETAVIAQRLSMPHCMGSLFWQFNDCWPSISWSGIDHFGRWKAVQFQVKRSFAPLLVTGELKKGHITVRAVSDHPVRNGSLIVRLISLSGKELYRWGKSVRLGPGSPQTLFETELPGDTADQEDFIAEVILRGGGLEVIGHSVCAPWGKLRLANPDLSHRIVMEENEKVLEIRADRPAFFIEISDEEGILKTEDNFFHLTDRKPFRVKIKTKKSSKLEVRSLWDYSR